MIMIGEKLNGTRAAVARAIAARYAAFIQALARAQARGGAAYLDVNAGTHPDSEPADLAWLVETVQAVCDLPLCLDSANPPALLAGIRAARRPPLLNSLSGERARVEGVLPLAARHGCELVVLALDDQGVPATAESRLAIVRRLVGLCREAGLADERLFVDPLTVTLATDPRGGLVFFESLSLIRAEFPRVHLTCGLSNISFGLPARGIVNQASRPGHRGRPGQRHPRPHLSRAQGHALRGRAPDGRDPACQAFNRPSARASWDGARGRRPGRDRPRLAGAGKGPGRAGLLVPAEEVPAEEAPAPRRPRRPRRRWPGGADPGTGWTCSGTGWTNSRPLSRPAAPPGGAGRLPAGHGRVGRRFENNEYFVPELILAGGMLKRIAERQALPGGRGRRARAAARPPRRAGCSWAPWPATSTTSARTSWPPCWTSTATRSRTWGWTCRWRASWPRPAIPAPGGGLSGFLTLAYDPMRATIAACGRKPRWGRSSS